MHTEIRVLERIGLLLAYPRGDYGDRLEFCRTTLPLGDVEADALVGSFVRQIQSLPLEKVQELYTHTFELNPVCALEVGWQLYGEEYARGARNFTEASLLPALNKMLAGFPDQNNPYRNVLLAITKLLSSDPGEGLAEAPRV